MNLMLALDNLKKCGSQRSHEILRKKFLVSLNIHVIYLRVRQPNKVYIKVFNTHFVTY